ncbi:RagB/SusD family nutrient uptake outer membrane protein [Flammeovirga aprica]|uniref:RagB/SusD family nutrient uptake outer membrane protein n=1 Tax=Flammeovirga aprica JL-4 TaxID=694437 RepID=A0A7X9RXT5_9BACT|nr:RagB/SusD family nutrient uptake outer membrane protein [Flammeovirga aprica]NME70642.1 RagB/SusD family nutrient uptake outer membrane protein [Flammeovirga aprica JL-4]
MKNRFKALVAGALIGLGASSCSNFLEREPLARETTKVFLSDPANIDRMLIAAYSPMLWSFSQTQFYPYFIFGDIASDDGSKGGGFEGDLDYMTTIQKFQWNASDPMFELVWQKHFAGVFRANNVLFALEASKEKIAEDDYNQAYSEARFLRGWHYFQLVKMFGGVPIIATEDDYTNIKNISRATEKDTYDFILNDFREAQVNLKLKGEYDATYLGRATKGMAQSYFAKAALYSNETGYYDEAYNFAKEVSGSGQYALIEFEKIWRLENENGAYSIFEVQFEPSAFHNWNIQSTGSYTNMMTSIRAGSDSEFGEGWGFNIPNKELDVLFREAGDDIRREQTLVYDGEVVYPEDGFEMEVPSSPSDTWYNTEGLGQQKYFLPLSEQTPSSIGDHRCNGHSNYRMFRYADLLLFQAELAIKLGKAGEAATPFNAVRTRAGLSSIGAPTLEQVYAERRLELAMEGHRFFDQVRTGQITQRLLDEGFKKGVHEKFPIPQSEIDLTDGVIEGNPSN